MNINRDLKIAGTSLLIGIVAGVVLDRLYHEDRAGISDSYQSEAVADLSFINIMAGLNVFNLVEDDRPEQALRLMQLNIEHNIWIFSRAKYPGETWVPREKVNEQVQRYCRIREQYGDVVDWTEDAQTRETFVETLQDYGC